MDRNTIDQLYSKTFSSTEIYDIRHDFHMHPEIGGKEYRTQAKIMEYLNAWGIPCEKIADTGVVARLAGKLPGKNVLVRGDIDCLPVQEETDVPWKSQEPGFMHACGHDMHATTVLGIAKMFKAMDGNFPGSVTFAFQPAEENLGGAQRMIDEGILENPHIDKALSLHVEPSVVKGYVGFTEGYTHANSTKLKIVVKGKSVHAAHPNAGIDPIVIAANIVTAIQTVVSRSIDPIDPAVVTFGIINGGTVENQIADEVLLKGTIRTYKAEVRELVKTKIASIAEGIASAMGGSAKAEMVDLYDAVYDHPEFVRFLSKEAKIFLGEDKVLEPPASMGGEDFGCFAKATGCGAQFRLYCGKEGAPVYPLHSSKFDPDESCLEIGVKLTTYLLWRIAEE